MKQACLRGVSHRAGERGGRHDGVLRGSGAGWRSIGSGRRWHDMYWRTAGLVGSWRKKFGLGQCARLLQPPSIPRVSADIGAWQILLSGTHAHLPNFGPLSGVILKIWRRRWRRHARTPIRI